jgi:hypothetical protein
MKCPSCGQQAISMLRYCTAFTRGVSFPQAIKGYLKCHNCGALLRIVGFTPTLWIYFVILFVVFFVFWMLLPRIIPNAGYNGSMGLLLLWFVFVIFGVIYVRWKNTRIDKT